PFGGACARRGLRTSRSWRSCARRIAIRSPGWRSGTGGSEQTIYTWRKRFGTFQADDVRRLKAPEAEDLRLKKVVAERDLEIEVMKEIAAKNSVRARRTAVAYATGRGLPQLRACTLLKVARSALGYHPRPAGKHAPGLARLAVP